MEIENVANFVFDELRAARDFDWSWFSHLGFSLYPTLPRWLADPATWEEQAR
jgi:hypothetical protein